MFEVANQTLESSLDRKALSFIDGRRYVHAMKKDISPDVERSFAPDSPERIFWEQIKFNGLKNKRQMRLHLLLNLKYVHAYRQSGIIHLPSERTLADYTWTSHYLGVQLEFIEKLSSFLEDVPCGHRPVDIATVR